jgi:hypothetical protein
MSAPSEGVAWQKTLVKTASISSEKKRFIYHFSGRLLLLYIYIIQKAPELNSCCWNRGFKMPHSTPDQDTAKGATEAEDHKTPGNVGLEEQLGHRDQDPILKDADSDFPEPGNNPEHSGEQERKTA